MEHWADGKKSEKEKNLKKKRKAFGASANDAPGGVK
jgi:hypothetical protein